DGDTYNFPAEVVEARFPVLVERYELNVAAEGGAGRNRGGFGVVREYRMQGGVDTYGYGSIGGSERPPWGLAGGREGTMNYLEYVRDGGEERWGRGPPVSLWEGQMGTAQG